jgi:hypothetical protein
MRYSGRINLVTVTSAIALGLLALVGVCVALLGRSPKQFDVEDRSFHFTFCAVTTGTNHTAISGNRVLGWVNRKLIGSRIHRISRDQTWTTITTKSETVLSIVYRHDVDTQKLSTNGYSDPITINTLDAVVVQPGGRMLPLKHFYGWDYDRTTKDYLITWILPEDPTNFLGCGLRLSRRGDGKYVATCRLQPKP